VNGNVPRSGTFGGPAGDRSDVRERGQTDQDGAADEAVRLGVVLRALVALGWNFDWIGAIGFSALAFLYAAMVWGRLDWISVISTPLLLVGLLFYASWRSRVVAHRAQCSAIARHAGFDDQR
jgi:hypothetical protein